MLRKDKFKKDPKNLIETNHQINMTYIYIYIYIYEYKFTIENKKKKKRHSIGI